MNCEELVRPALMCQNIFVMCCRDSLKHERVAERLVTKDTPSNGT
jgi:hypothetical protein